MRVSVVIPTRNASASLRRCLAAIQSNTLAPAHCIVVDDYSDEPVQEIVEDFGFTYMRTPRHMGPAAARNLGAKATDSDILFFTDDDVEIRPDTLEHVQQTFAANPELTAVIGSYDDAPGHPDFLSQYRNLLHHFVHQSSRVESSNFWSGCGAIRRQEFLDVGGFSESYRRPSVEDIDLGYRLHARRRRIVLDKSLQVKHLKAWTLLKVLATDIRDRGFPWARLCLDQRYMPADLNLTIPARLSVFLAVLVAVGTAWSALAWSVEAAAIPLWLIVAGLLASKLSGAVRQDPSNNIRQLTDWGFGSLLIVVTSLIFLRVSSNPGVQLATASFLALVALNASFYLFLIRKRGLLFAIGAAPVQLLFHLGNALSFTAAVGAHILKRGRVPERDPQTAQASID